MLDNSQPDQKGACTERSRILDVYEAAVKHYTKVGRDVSECAISYEADMFAKAWAVCQTAEQECKGLRKELHRHMIEHGCCGTLGAM